jgi:Cd2+/Zn2+-exporting ATPase
MMGQCCDSQPKKAMPIPDGATSCCLPAAQAAMPEGLTPGQRSTQIRIAQMDCPVEERLITDKLAGMPGVDALQFNLLNRTLTLVHQDDALQPALDAIVALGFSAERLDPGQKAMRPLPAGAPTWKLLLAGLAALGAELLHFSEGAADWLIAALALLAIVLCGLGTYRKGLIALRNLDLNINALMSIAVSGAMLIGQWPEAAMVMFLFALAERIEAGSLERARNAIQGLLALSPETARVQQADGSWVERNLPDIGIGALILVRPGERVAMDGKVLKGRSSINQAPITGESMPVDKAEGDPVFAGTINQGAELLCQVTAVASQSTLARIIHAVEQAQASRAPTQHLVDRFSRIYTPMVVLLALLVAILPPLLGGADWLEWVYRALVLLVVACPCALVISTPVTLVSGLAAAARMGILIKGGVHLENGRRLTHLALDKTGTLTHGRPRQTDFLPLSGHDPQRCRSIAASLARRSDHPVSRAIAEQAQQDALAAQDVQDFAALPGRGVQGVVDGRHYQLGNHRLLEERGLCSAQIEAQLDALERQGKTAVILSDQTRALAIFAVADTLRDSSRQAIAELHELGVKTLMLSGDNPHTVASIAAQAGIDESHGNLLPEDKLQIIESLSNGHNRVGMVGDGINDAPALARADLGFAMAAMGTDTAIETADIAIMDDDLGKIPRFIRLSRQAMNILLQNIVLAIGIKVIFLGMTLSGHATLWMAVFADMGVSLLVVLNGLRLLRVPRRQGAPADRMSVHSVQGPDQ